MDWEELLFAIIFFGAALLRYLFQALKRGKPEPAPGTAEDWDAGDEYLEPAPDQSVDPALRQIARRGQAVHARADHLIKSLEAGKTSAQLSALLKRRIEEPLEEIIAQVESGSYPMEAANRTGLSASFAEPWKILGWIATAEEALVSVEKRIFDRGAYLRGRSNPPVLSPGSARAGSAAATDPLEEVERMVVEVGKRLDGSMPHRNKFFHSGSPLPLALPEDTSHGAVLLLAGEEVLPVRTVRVGPNSTAANLALVAAETSLDLIKRVEGLEEETRAVWSGDGRSGDLDGVERQLRILALPWSDGLFVDLLGGLMLGPAYLRALMEWAGRSGRRGAVVSGGEAYVEHGELGHLRQVADPPVSVRIYALVEALSRRGYGEEVKEILMGQRHNVHLPQVMFIETTHGQVHVPGVVMTGAVSRVLEEVERAPLRALGGQPLSGLAGLVHDQERQREAESLAEDVRRDLARTPVDPLVALEGADLLSSGRSGDRATGRLQAWWLLQQFLGVGPAAARKNASAGVGTGAAARPERRAQSETGIDGRLRERMTTRGGWAEAFVIGDALGFSVRKR